MPPSIRERRGVHVPDLLEVTMLQTQYRRYFQEHTSPTDSVPASPRLLASAVHPTNSDIGIITPLPSTLGHRLAPTGDMSVPLNWDQDTRGNCAPCATYATSSPRMSPLELPSAFDWSTDDDDDDGDHEKDDDAEDEDTDSALDLFAMIALISQGYRDSPARSASPCSQTSEESIQHPDQAHFENMDQGSSYKPEVLTSPQERLPTDSLPSHKSKKPTLPQDLSFADLQTLPRRHSRISHQPYIPNNPAELPSPVKGRVDSTAMPTNPLRRFSQVPPSEPSPSED